MDISFTNLTKPRLEARFCPIYWEPQAGAHDRITSLVAVLPTLESSGHFAPAAHCILSVQKLRAMLGTVRGNSAHGILSEVAVFMTQQLSAGLDLEELSAPFTGFSIGEPGTVRGFSAEQLLTAAVQMVSTLGSAEEFIEDTIPVDSRATTATTREFLKNVRMAFANDVEDRKKRFHRKYAPAGSPEITLDYQHNDLLVQFASLPATAHQLSYMNREAESKLFEILTARTTIHAPTKPLLIVNSQALTLPTSDSRLLAKITLDRFKGLAEAHNVATFVAQDEQAAVRELEKLG